MSSNGFRYEYLLQTNNPLEYEAVNFAYLSVGWKEVDALPDKVGNLTRIIFEWQQDRPPLYPRVNWP